MEAAIILTYEITACVRPDLLESYLTYMQKRHIPEVMATGRFLHAHLLRTDATQFRMVYWTESQTILDQYLLHDAPVLRADFQAHFPEGVTLERRVWNQLQEWKSSSK